MSSYPTPDFGRRAARYDELRPADENWREVCDALIREGDLAGRRVLDVGCGTGKFVAALSERAKVERELPAAGFGTPSFTRLSQTASVSREQALERIRGKHIATFDLIPDAEYEAGVARAERELPERVDYRQEWLLVVAEAR